MTLQQLDQHKTAMFTRFEGDRAACLDKKLGVDYQMYNALNMQAQKAALKALDASRKVNSSIPNRASGLGKVDAMNRKMKGSNSNLDPVNVSKVCQTIIIFISFQQRCLLISWSNFHIFLLHFLSRL